MPSFPRKIVLLVALASTGAVSGGSAVNLQPAVSTQLRDVIASRSLSQVGGEALNLGSVFFTAPSLEASSARAKPSFREIGTGHGERIVRRILVHEYG